MRTINIHEAKTHLSKLVDDVAEGEELIIAKAGKPMARLVPLAKVHKRRRLGSLAGRFEVPDDFDAPLPDDLLDAFEGGAAVRLLVDTHVLLWAVGTPERLSAQFRDLLEHPRNTILFSAASIWEVAIKLQTGRLRLPVEPDQLARSAVEHEGFEELAITSAHAALVLRLPLHHRDPFDRLLVAQAMHEPARLLTVDRTLGRYGDMVEVFA